MEKGKTMREKLIELIEQVQYHGMAPWKHGMQAIGNTEVADHLIQNGVTIQKWIPVTERLPEEHDSIFAKLYGTERFLPGMFKTISENVLAVFVLEDGRKRVKETHTNEGKWNMSGVYGAKEVTHWMPLPEPPKED